MDPTAPPARPPADGLAYPVPAPILADPETPSGLTGTVPTSAVVPAADDGTTAATGPSAGAPGGNGAIPTRVLDAYQRAAARLAAEDPDCHLSWQLLAAIGRVESNHAANRTVASDGTVTPAVLGPELDGTDGTARIDDTDDGHLDQDTVFDRAVGPMQFIPTTWANSGRDGNGDRVKDPGNIDDAALTAAGYLCDHDRDLTDPTDLHAAIYAYNPSGAYVAAVLAWKAAYDGTPTATTVTLATGDLPAVRPSIVPLTSPPTPRATTSAIPSTPGVPGAAPSPTPRPTTGPTLTTMPRPTTTPKTTPTASRPFPIFTLTPRATPTPTPSLTPPAPSPTPSSTPTLTPTPTVTPEPTPAPCPDAIIDSTTLAATAADLDPDNPGYEALDITGVLAGTSSEPVDVTMTAAAAAGPVTSVKSIATPATEPQLLGRLDSSTISGIATTGSLTLELVASVGNCQLGTYTLTVTGIDPAAFAATTSPAD